MDFIEKKLNERSDFKCEISRTEHDLVIYTLSPFKRESLEHSVLIAKKLKDQIDDPKLLNENDWRGLSESMWNENLPVRILSWRMLYRLKNNDLLDMMYFDEETLDWAKATDDFDDADEIDIFHIDCNGVILEDGDSVVLIKDLDVKGASFTAKRGVAVHNIKLVWNDTSLIEGRVENQNIYIMTKYVKKTK